MKLRRWFVDSHVCSLKTIIAMHWHAAKTVTVVRVLYSCCRVSSYTVQTLQWSSECCSSMEPIPCLTRISVTFYLPCLLMIWCIFVLFYACFVGFSVVLMRFIWSAFHVILFSLCWFGTGNSIRCVIRKLKRHTIFVGYASCRIRTHVTYSASVPSEHRRWQVYHATLEEAVGKK